MSLANWRKLLWRNMAKRDNWSAFSFKWQHHACQHKIAQYKRQKISTAAILLASLVCEYICMYVSILVLS